MKKTLFVALITFSLSAHTEHVRLKRAAQTGSTIVLTTAATAGCYYLAKSLKDTNSYLGTAIKTIPLIVLAGCSLYGFINIISSLMPKSTKFIYLR